MNFFFFFFNFADFPISTPLTHFNSMTIQRANGYRLPNSIIMCNL